MEQFSLDKWLQDKSRKVVTRQGKPVRIICTDRKHSESWPIVALESYDSGEFVLYANDKGRTDLANENIHDLFFADEEEELTEFDYAVLSIISDHNSHKDSIGAFAKRSSKKLLELARKELEKDLPKWKKCVGSTGPFIDDFKGEEYLYLNDYVIKISDLERLPKEEE